MSIESINPADGTVIEQYSALKPSELESRLDAASAAFKRHRRTSFQERSEKLIRCADLLEERSKSLGELMTREMGKPIKQAIAEAEKCAWVCRYYAENAEGQLADQNVETDAGKSYVAFQPLGPILAIMPWNFPFWQVFRFAAPALMAGNVALLKHASNVSGCAIAIEDILREAGFDGDEFQTLLVGSDAVEDVINDDRIRAVTLTGSEGAGMAVGAAASKAIKPSVLELGGSDPFIVLADADLDLAIKTAVSARMQNNGQSCIAAKRFIVEDDVYDRFLDRFVSEVERMKIGDPMDESTELGPLARADLRDDIHDQVERAIAEGARLMTGGRKLDRPGFFYAPTILADVAPGTVAFEEEIFGPVASVICARDEEHAVALANDTTFGLGGSVFTRDAAKGERVARELEVGCAFVNEMVKSDPRLPFGGVKRSGYGRELAEFGIREFVNIKTIWIR
jgi:succinate-semialdehyde dehydrogenase / glutarate-semialdehyde dehydrogenase